MKIVFIYTLEHPLTNEIRYVGKTRNPKMRFHNHCNKLHNERTHKRNWINKLKGEGLKPIMNILDEVSEEEWKLWERYWIEQLKAWGFNLCNHSSGGEGSILGNSTSFKKGNKPWNTGKAKPKIRKGFNKICLTTSFKKGHNPWNKNRNGYKLHGLKSSFNVNQYSKDGELINTYEGCREAALELGCIPENIRRCCVGLSKSAKGYIWKYK